MSRTIVISGLIAAGLLALAAAAGAQPVPPGDPYLCYKAKLSEEKFTRVQKTLEDQFGTLVADVKGVVTLCNPTQIAAHPAVHAVGYKITRAKEPPQAKFVKRDHTAIDEFGTHPLTVVKPTEVRAPSAKVLGAGGTDLVDTTGVDHFECYKAKPAKGAPKFVPPAPLEITDQFGTQSYTLKKITKLCTPVNKDDEDPTAPQHVGHVVCYKAKLPAKTKVTAQTVSVNNTNFGPAVLDTKKAVPEVCVPAFKDTVPTTTTTTTSTSTTTTTLQLSCSVAQPCAGGVECCAGTCLPADSFCEQRCSESTTVSCVANADCQWPPCVECIGTTGQTCEPQVIRNECGAGSCLSSEHCCAGSTCCRNADQACSAGVCQQSCSFGSFSCGETCCLNAQVCQSGACKTSCGPTSCFEDTELCCGDVCCDSATQTCGQQAGTCAPRPPTCTGTDVYIQLLNICCPQEAACTADTACCDLALEHCDTATNQCVSNP